MNNPRVSPQSLASGELDSLASDFAQAGIAVGWPGQGMLELGAAPDKERARILLSVGIHGDETAPIELLARILSSILDEPRRLQVGLMIIVGNLDAIARQKRYVDVDLNRLFHDGLVAEEAKCEVARAMAIMAAVKSFFSKPAGEKIHLDLHTAIRASCYPSFAIVPAAVGKERKRLLSTWMGKAGIEAVVMNNRPAHTFSAYTAECLDAVSATAELGRVGKLGENDLSGLLPMQIALGELLGSGALIAEQRQTPQIFEVAQEIIKHSAGFNMALDASVENFTPLGRGMEIARDGERIYRVNAETEYILFPNPNVAVGQRAGLTLTRFGGVFS
jgi:succinylglutamate desuccinylase